MTSSSPMKFDDGSFQEESPEENENFNEDIYVDDSLPSGSPWADAMSGDPPILPRVGSQYQVAIPSLLEKSSLNHLQHCGNGNDLHFLNYSSRRELAVPIMWICHEGDNMIDEQIQFANTGYEKWVYPYYSTFTGLEVSVNSHDTCSQFSTCKARNSDDHLEHGKESASMASLLRNPSPDSQSNARLCCSQSQKTRVFIPLPGSPVARWSNAESQSFLLGLYIFGKNLIQVRNFVESKKMGDVLCFYYGKFYRSDPHRRWVDYRKARGKRSILGHRIFTGGRQQELFSRLIPNIPKEVQHALLEASKNYNDGRTSLEEFVFALKAMVGMEALVQAIGIGKGKQDLTSTILDSVRANAANQVRSEVPIGKAWASLTSGEIIKFLTGDFRLSKARSNDLFWEAVWPRLLARGWHSEQPNDINALSSKNALVFLMPGIKKFSRRKLVKGNHYFDSVSDVLNKVASDTELLKLENEEAEEGSRIGGECQKKLDAKLDRNDTKKPSYLRPRLPESKSEMKFTVVDTSLVDGEEPYKVRELRSLPPEVPTRYRVCDRSEESDSDSSDQSSSTDMSCNGHNGSDQSVSDDHKMAKRTKNNDVEGRHCDKEEEENGKDMKLLFSGRVKCKETNSLPVVSKRPRLAPCKNIGAETHSEYKREEKLHLKMKQHEDIKPVDDEVKRSRRNDGQVIFKSHLRGPIDLNIPMEMDSEAEGSVKMEVEEIKKDTIAKETMQPDDNQLDGRRHSTRSRPPTTKALEAVASGFFNTRKGKGAKANRPSSLRSRSSSARQAQRGTETYAPDPDTDPGRINP